MPDPAAAEPPSGRQFALQRGSHQAVVTEVGASLRRYAVDGRDVVDGYDLGHRCDGGRGQVLVPWPNRVADGRYTWDGQAQQLALTEPERRTAIHGLTRWLTWVPRDVARDSVRLDCRLRPQPGWPFLLDVTVLYVLDGAGLRVETTITNVGSERAPVAVGAHPYLSAAGPSTDGLVDGCLLQLPADTLLVADERGIPTGRRLPVERTEQDFRQARQIGSLLLDATFGDLHRIDTRATVTLTRPDGSAVALWAGEGFRYLQLFTGDTLAAGRRRGGLAVEPMTAPPNALATGEDLDVLEPGGVLRLVWGLGPV